MNIRDALRGGQNVYSTAVVAHSPLWPKAVARGGCDFVFVDSEHTPVDRETLAWVCRGYTAVGVPPVVRIPSPDPYEAAKVLDGGAAGFIAPYIETVEQLKQLTGVARYRPLKGQRLADAVDDPATLDTELGEYLRERNEHTIFIANIESVPAIENLSALLSIENGVDAVLIGPHDLSCSLGIPEQYDHPDFDAAVKEIFRTAREHGVGAGIHFWLKIEMEVDWSKAGGNLIMHGADVHLFGDSLKRDLDYLRSQLGDTRKQDADQPDVI